MNNLVIGNTSQLSHYFPEEYHKISSRSIDFGKLKNTKWDKVFLCFGESKKFINDEDLYDKVNYSLSLDIIQSLYSNVESFVVYSTCELWNRYSGQISLDLPFDFYTTPYLISKYKLSKKIISENYSKVKILFPFNFNSIYRNQNFLFGKIFHSIINETTIEIGDTFFYRDIVHPKFVVNESIKADSHKIVGSGRLTFVNDFICDLYENFGLDYNKFVITKKDKYKEYNKIEEYYLKTENCVYDYQTLLEDTINDIKKIKNARSN